MRNVQLPFQGRIKYRNENMCRFCFLGCELYVERGRAVITANRFMVVFGGICDNQVPIEIDLRHSYLVEHRESCCLFEVRIVKGNEV